jgi:hypothetical protein
MNILISGGTGLVGGELTRLLTDNGHRVTILSRKKMNKPGFVQWDINNNYLQEGAFDGIDTIIHLAGEGIADKLWTDQRKVEIIESRVKSTRLLFELLSENNHQVKTFISSSAIGYYSDRGDLLLTEDDSPSKDFLGTTCIAWENEVNKIEKLGIRTVKLRTGIVLSLKGGALKQMILPFWFHLGSPLGNGKQWMSWIHLHDLCAMFKFAAENTSLSGVYNAVAPNPVTNYEFSKQLAEVMHKRFWAPNIPAFILKIIFGEMSAVVLGSTRVSSKKIESSGYSFKFKTLNEALKNLIVQ